MLDGVALPLQMVVNLFIFDRFVAAVSLVRAPELQLAQHLFVEFVDFARCLAEALAAAFFVTNKVLLLSTLEAYQN